MSTTTIRLSEELKERIAAVAARAGTTPHSFMLAAIVEQTDLAERRADFDETADARLAQFLAEGESIPWPEMRRYLEDRIQGKTVPRPVAKKLTRSTMARIELAAGVEQDFDRSYSRLFRSPNSGWGKPCR